VKRRVIVACGALSLALGCAEIYGLGDYTQQDGGGGDGAVDVAEELAPLPPGPDGGCTGVCVADLPSGWTFIAYDQAFRPACAANFQTPTPVAEGLSAAPATCGCSCAMQTPPCSNLTVTAGNSGTNGCQNKSSQALVWDGGCLPVTSIVTAAGDSVSVTASGNGGCAPDDASVVLPSPTYASQGNICQMGVSPGAGCTSGVCVPDPAPYKMCVYQTGDVACPAAYSVKHVVGTGLSDGRGCTGCTCTFDGGGGCGGSATLYTGGACNAQSLGVTADGTCHAVSTQTFKSMSYQPTAVGGACVGSGAPTPTGTATFATTATVCCAQ
jgi:hypothetical protein